jgi:hypothetical protein
VFLHSAKSLNSRIPKLQFPTQRTRTNPVSTMAPPLPSANYFAVLEPVDGEKTQFELQMYLGE